jgi:hypothetical protein
MATPADLARGWMQKYDTGFWPDLATAQQALAAADRVRTAVLAVLPPAAHP